MGDSQEELDISFAGLWTSANPFSSVPNGALEVADNVVIRDPSLVEPRRGYAATANIPSSLGIVRVFSWGGRLFAVDANGGVYDYLTGTGWSSAYNLTASAPDSSTPVRAASAAKSLFVSTGHGICVLDGVGNSFKPAGILPSPYLLASLSNSGSTWLANTASVAYRVVFCRYDANKNLIQSATSPRLVVTNSTGSAANVTVQALLPYQQGFTGVYTFAQLYRTASAVAGVDPGDEYFLVGEHTITATDVSAAFATFAVDIATDGFTTGQLPLCTNQNTGGSATGDNEQPPLARELCLFNTVMLYANTTSPQTLELQLIGTSGLSNGSTVVLAGQTFFAGFTETPNTFQLYTGGTAAQNIENTARSFCRVVSAFFSTINDPLYTGYRLAAYYVSGAADAPGQMVLQELGVGGAAFTFQAGQNGQTCWVPDASSTSLISTSDPDRLPARLWYATDGVPWAVPSDNWVDVGAEDQAILRVMVVRSTVFIFKQDGVWTMQFGSDGSPVLTPLDPGLILQAPETAQVVDNAIFCLTNHGCVYVTEAGVAPAVSKPIERDINTIQTNNTQYMTSAFGVAHADELWWVLAVPLTATDTGCSQQYVFHAGNPAWVRWLLANAMHGCLDAATRKLVFCVGKALWIERRTYMSSDIVDPNGPIVSTVRPMPITGGMQITEKTFDSVVLSFRTAEFVNCTVGFDSEKSPVTTSATKAGPAIQGFGQFPFGGQPTIPGTKNFLIRVDQPQGTGGCTTLGMTLGISSDSRFWQLQGIKVLYTPGAPIPRRGS